MSFLCPRRRTRQQQNPTQSSSGSNEELNLTPVQRWQRSPKTLDNLQIFLQSNPPLSVLIAEMHSFKKEIYQKLFFENVLRSYLQHLDTILAKGDQAYTQDQHQTAEEERKQIKKELAMCCLVDTNFTYSELSRHVAMPPVQLLRVINHKVIDPVDKRAMILALYLYCSKSIAQLLDQYVMYSLDLNPQFFVPFIVNHDEYLKAGVSLNPDHSDDWQELENREPYIYPFVNSSQQVLKIVNKLAYQLGNFGTAIQLCEAMISADAYLPGADLQALLFLLKVGGHLTYRLGRVGVSMKQLDQLSPQDVVAEFLKTQSIQTLNSFKYVFDVLPEGSFAAALERFALAEQTDLSVLLELVQSNYIRLTEQNLNQVAQKIGQGYFEYSKFEPVIRNLLQGFESRPEVELLLLAIQYSKIFYIFDINSQLQVLVSLLKNVKGMINKPTSETLAGLQEQALLLFREFIAKVALCRNKEQKLVVAGSFFDLQSAETVFRLSRFLKQNLFGQVLNFGLMQQMIFQSLIAFERLSFVEELLQQRFINRYQINYSMVEMVVIEQIHEKFLTAQSFHTIQHSLEYLVELLTTKTLERKILMATYKLALYLHTQGVHLPPSRLVNSLDVSLLYSLANLQPQLDFDRVYKYILKTSLTRVDQKVDIENKEFHKFKGELAVKLFRKGFHQQAYDTLSKLSVYRPSWLCATVLTILEQINNKFTDRNLSIEKQLMTLGFESVQNGSQLLALNAVKIKAASVNKQNELSSFYKKFIDPNTTYHAIDDFVVRNEQIYNNLIAQCKFTDTGLQAPEYDLFFVLLPSEPERAFSHVARRNLNLNKIDFFIKQCVKQDVLDYVGIVQYFYQAALKQLDLDGTESHDKIMADTRVSQTFKPLFSKLHSASCILKVCPRGFLEKWVSNKDRMKFLQDKAYRRKELVELLHRISPQDCHILSKIAESQSINLIELAMFSLCNLLNTETIPKSSETLVHNFCVLSASTPQGARQTLQKLISRIYSLPMLMAFISYLIAQKNAGYDNQNLVNAILPYNFAILQSLARVEVNNEFFGMVPKDFLSTPITHNPKSQLTANHKQILARVLRLENVFVVSKAMYFFYGLNNNIEEQVLSMLASKSPQLERKMEEIRKLKMV